MSPTRLAVVVLMVAVSSPAFAGVIIEGSELDGESKKTSRFLMEGQKLRMETAEGDAMIFDGATHQSVQLDPANKTYTEFTKEDVAKMKAMMEQARAAGASAGAGAPAPKKKAGTIRYEKTGKTDSALGKGCDVYRIRGEDGEIDEEMCLAPWGSFGVQRADFAGFRAFGEFASDMSGGEVQRDWADLPGIPLIAWDKEGEERKESFRATKIEKRSIPASQFAVPAGWTKNPGFAEQMRQMEQQLKPGGGAGK
jgi:hypothetical protein